MRKPKLEKTIITIDCQYMYPEYAAAYLIIEGERAAFVDNNTRHAVPKLLNALASTGLSPEQVTYLIITHVHLDHAGGTAALLKHCPNAVVLAHPRAARHLINPAKLVGSAKALYGEANFMRLYGEIEPIDETRVIQVNDGDKLSLDSRTFQFIHTTGHAKHHMCVYDYGSGCIFTGDAFGLAYPLLQGGSEPFIFPSTSPADFNSAEAQSSIHKIIDTGATIAYLTHFGAVKDIKLRMGKLISYLDTMGGMLQDAAISGLEDDDLNTFCYKAMFNFFRGEIERRGMPFNSNIQKFLQNDIELNAKGIAVAAIKSGRR
jgi:glyoxylase-like metal-dependent hydrolase (beta-lactamase superfamily II)